MKILTLNEICILALIVFLLVFLIGKRVGYMIKDRALKKEYDKSFYAICQTTGSKEIQADVAEVFQNSAGVMAVVADGIGKENTGKICAQIAVDTMLDHFEPYHVLENPAYFFRTSFTEANSRIQKTIGNRHGGTSLGVLFMDRKNFYYGLAGNIRIALFRREELIPLSKGHTMDVLAVKAYHEGRLSRQETLWSLEENRVWNYLGKDCFHEMELCEQPIQIKSGDIIFLATNGVFEELSWAEIEDVLLSEMTLQQKADSLIMGVDRKPGHDKENGSVLLLKAEVFNEKDQF